MSAAAPLQNSLREKIEGALRVELNPQHLEVIDESHEHSRRTAKNPETHFNITVVSDAFAGLNRVKRQQKVYSALKAFFAEGLHAVTQNTFTPEEWDQNPELTDSPSCVSKKKC